MRNLFDQYRHAENRLTHAFFTALDRDRSLLLSFLQQFGIRDRANAMSLTLSVQTVPGRPEPPEHDEMERRGIPDAWIHNGDDWCLIIETKIMAPLTADQITRHIRTARRLGFSSVTAMAITAQTTPAAVEEGVVSTTWSRIYRWLKANAGSFWAHEAASYFETLEARMIDDESLSAGTLTEFAGFPFQKTSDYSYLEARRVLRLAMGALRKDARLADKLGVDPKIPGRTAITGKDEDRIWDYLALRTAKNSTNHTRHPHLTLNLGQTVEAMITVPNSINTRFRQRLIGLGEEGFLALARTVLKNVDDHVLAAEPLATPTVRAIQRRYPTQRSVPFVDGLIEFDIRTAFSDRNPVKPQPEWLASVFEAFSRKRSNLQLQMGVKFDVARCPAMQTAAALDLVAMAWLACKPLVDLELN